MKRIVLGAALFGPLAACTYVERQPAYTQPGYVQQGYVQQGYAQPNYYGAASVAPAPGYRDGSYEAERQAYEYGRRDGAARAQGWR